MRETSMMQYGHTRAVSTSSSAVSQWQDQGARASVGDAIGDALNYLSL